MKKILLILLIAMIQLISAANVVAVLEIIPADDEIEMKLSEYRLLTDELRKKARESLPAEFTILTRDNIISLLPQDEKEMECLAESCAIDIGRAIGAEYITQGHIRRFQGKLTLTVELYASINGNLISSFVSVQDSLIGLLNEISANSPAMFEKIVSKKIEVVALDSASMLQATTHMYQFQKTKMPLIVAISLDVLGATAIGFGIYQNSQASKHHKDYKNMLKTPDKSKESEYDKTLNKANDAKSLRDAGFIIGSALIVGGIAIHIWF